MTIENISLFQAMNAKMGYLAERQKIISQNVANADTPGYMSQDLRKVDFSKMVENISKNKMHVTMDTNNPQHMMAPDQSPNPKMAKSKTPYEVKPDGNSVVLEEQMVKASDVQMNYTLMLNLYRDAADMIKTSLGKKT
ncbi:MAG: flagellar basal body rod protein FlgB [Alphaproteobacteria bacterium]|nr:flagellar basal body rod protein FlgB [Alphaproteobacteria bacterium]